MAVIVLSGPSAVLPSSQDSRRETHVRGGGSGPIVTEDPFWTALGQGLAGHPDDALMLLRAVRSQAGAVIDLRYEWVNAAADRNAGDRLQGRTVLEVYSATDAFLLPDQTALLASGGWRQMQLTFPSDGDDERLRGRVYGLFMVAVDEDRLVCQFRDLTDRRSLQQQLEHHAGHDELTGLPNRRLLWEHLELALSGLERGDQSLAMLLCDLDRFKAVNGTCGHAAGDDLLRQGTGGWGGRAPRGCLGPLRG